MRAALVTMTLLAAALVAWRWLWRFWLGVVVGWGTYRRTVEWLDPAMLLLGGLAALLLVAVGFLLVTFGRPPHAALVSTAVGALFSFVQLYGAHYAFPQGAEALDYFWTYGLYAIPPMASFIGAICASALVRRNAV